MPPFGHACVWRLTCCCCCMRATRQRLTQGRGDVKCRVPPAVQIETPHGQERAVRTDEVEGHEQRLPGLRIQMTWYTTKIHPDTHALFNWPTPRPSKGHGLSSPATLRVSRPPSSSICTCQAHGSATPSVRCGCWCCLTARMKGTPRPARERMATSVYNYGPCSRYRDGKMLYIPGVAGRGAVIVAAAWATSAC